ncbi:MAG: dicarboxylate/amino acid:cation symporter [Bacteroidales bacterium]|nr:dicarboxylate/amino acid:cation symporter [Bacteroidales bacterium]
MNLRKINLLGRIVLAIIAGVICGAFLPWGAIRIFQTFNDLFSNFLNFLIPLIIIGLVTPAIANIGKDAGKLLVITVLIAYLDSIFCGFLSFGISDTLFPKFIGSFSDAGIETVQKTIPPYFEITLTPMFDVLTALVFSFVLGLGIAFLPSPGLKQISEEFKDIIVRTIEKAIIPLLPLYIFGIFLYMTWSGQAIRIISVFIEIIGIIFAMHIVILLIQYGITGLLTKRSPWTLLRNMLPAYFTALGTSSSAATIPVTLAQTEKNGVDKDIAGFVVPLCATIHLSGSIMKITACAVALMLMQGMPIDAGQFAGFILMLGVMMVAAPGVPGGAIMAALGTLSTMLGFSQEQQALMIALYITMDSFGTACNVTGDGAIALIIDRFFGKNGKNSN